MPIVGAFRSSVLNETLDFASLWDKKKLYIANSGEYVFTHDATQGQFFLVVYVYTDPFTLAECDTRSVFK